MTGFRSCAAHQIPFGDRMKEEEMGGACGTRGERGGSYVLLVCVRRLAAALLEYTLGGQLLV